MFLRNKRNKQRIWMKQTYSFLSHSLSLSPPLYLSHMSNRNRIVCEYSNIEMKRKKNRMIVGSNSKPLYSKHQCSNRWATILRPLMNIWKKKLVYMRFCYRIAIVLHICVHTYSKKWRQMFVATEPCKKSYGNGPAYHIFCCWIRFECTIVFMYSK